MSNNNLEKNKIGLVDLFAVLIKRKIMICWITASGMIAAVIFSIISILLPPEISPLPNLYTPKACMLINNDGVQGMNLNMGGLAEIAGISAPMTSTNSSLAIYLVRSDPILDAIIEKFNFVKLWKIKKYPIAESRKVLRKRLKCNYDELSGVLTVKFVDYDASLAKEVVNYAVALLEAKFQDLGVDKNILQKQNLEENIASTYEQILKLQAQIRDLELSVSNVYAPNSTPSIMMDTSMVKTELTVQETIYKQLKAQYENLKITMASEKPTFQVLEYAEIPDQKSGPSRGKLCIVISFLSFFFAVFLAFLLSTINHIKSDSEIMEKLRGNI